jgi:hypothetical protein
LRLHAIPIDRCDGHGVWFDHAELQAVLLGSIDAEIAERLKRRTE